MVKLSFDGQLYCYLLGLKQLRLSLLKVGKRKALFLRHLRLNAREKLNFMSRNTGIPVSTLFDFLKEARSNYIRRFTALFDFSSLGYACQSHLFLKVKHSDLAAVRYYLFEHAEVNSVWKINNKWSFIVETVHKDIRDLNIFVENIQSQFLVEKIEIHYLIEEIKKEGFMVGVCD